MGAHGQTVKQQLDCPSLPTQRATITIRAEQAKNSSSLVVFELGATGCSNNRYRIRIVGSRASARFGVSWGEGGGYLEGIIIAIRDSLLKSRRDRGRGTGTWHKMKRAHHYFS